VPEESKPKSTSPKSITYADAGVDISRGDRAKDRIKYLAQKTFNRNVLGGIGGFGALFRLDLQKFKSPILVSSADGVGTKLKIAFEMGLHSSVGADLVNHCVNDIAVQGATPLFFLDYFASGKLDPEVTEAVVGGLAEACRANGCALIGGETAQMPGFYADGEYDLAGFIVGAVERSAIIDGARVTAGDAVLGLPSSGLHTNGYSLVRRIIRDRELDFANVLPGTDEPLRELLLRPHRSYLDAVRELRSSLDIRALAHITGGGLKENVPRVLPEGLGVELERDSWPVPAIFGAIEKVGGVHPDEMWRTFNMGIGMVVIVPAEQANAVTSTAGIDVLRIGRVVTQSTSERVVLR